MAGRVPALSDNPLRGMPRRTLVRAETAEDKPGVGVLIDTEIIGGSEDVKEFPYFITINGTRYYGSSPEDVVMNARNYSGPQAIAADRASQARTDRASQASTTTSLSDLFGAVGSASAPTSGAINPQANAAAQRAATILSARDEQVALTQDTLLDSVDAASKAGSALTTAQNEVNNAQQAANNAIRSSNLQRAQVAAAQRAALERKLQTKRQEAAAAEATAAEAAAAAAGAAAAKAAAALQQATIAAQSAASSRTASNLSRSREREAAAQKAAKDADTAAARAAVEAQAAANRAAAIAALKIDTIVQASEKTAKDAAAQATLSARAAKDDAKRVSDLITQGTSTPNRTLNPTRGGGRRPRKIKRRPRSSTRKKIKR
jgi:hypothetical protein